MTVYLVGLGGCFAPLASAGCPVRQKIFTSCQIADRNTEVFVCFDDQVATYSYGPVGGPPDLFLSEPVAHVDFEAWSGLGRAIHETVTFYSGNFSYEVGGGLERPFSEEEMQLGPRRFGWVEVAQNGDSLSRLECKPETVTYGFGDGGLYGAKTAAGLVWDDPSKTWVPAAPVRAPVLRTETRLHDGGDCLPATEFSLEGVTMGDPWTSLGKLRSPEASGVFMLGGQEVNRMALVGMEIDIFRNVVIGMNATTALWEMPSGLRVGLTRGEVIQLLGRAPNGATPTAKKFTTLMCSEDQEKFAEWNAVIVFGPDKRVQSTGFANFAP